MSIRGFFSRLFGRDLTPPSTDAKLEPARTARLHPEALAIARGKLEEALTILGAAERVSDIEEIVVDEHRVLYQLLPVRVYLYDLRSSMGKWEFKAACEAKRSPGSVLKTGTFACSGASYGYYLYSLRPIPDYEARRAGAGADGAATSSRAAQPDAIHVSLEGSVEEVADALLAPHVPKTYIDEIELSSTEKLGQLIACLMLRKHQASLEKDEIVRFVKRNRVYLEAGVLDPLNALIDAASHVEGGEDNTLMWSYFLKQVAHARAGDLDRIDVKSDRLFWLVYAATAKLEQGTVTYPDAVAILSKPDHRARISPLTLQFMLFDYVDAIGMPQQPAVEFLLLVLECAFLGRQSKAARAALAILAGLPFPRRASISGAPFKRARSWLESEEATTEEDRAVMERIMARFEAEVADDDL